MIGYLSTVLAIRKINFRYLLDLYTLTFDEDETVDEIKVMYCDEGGIGNTYILALGSLSSGERRNANTVLSD